MKESKRVKSLKEKLDLKKEYSIEEAVKILQDSSKVKFVESLDCAIRLGVDPRHADQMIRGTVSLPHGTGKEVIAAPDTMGELGKLGRMLGPKGLMPNPKSGTVTMDVTSAVKEVKAGKIEFRVEKTGIVHTTLGKLNFESTQLVDNIQAFIDKIIRMKPASAKGTYVKSLYVTSTMGPGIHITKDAY